MTRTGVGALTITHNFGSTNYSFTGSAEIIGSLIFTAANILANSFTISTFNLSAAASDANVNIIVARN